MPVNDFTIQIATVNGTGSQSANTILLRSIFAMGIPCGGKNIFPSNIAGLPTWFVIRASERGYLARRRDVDLVVTINPATLARDLEAATPGAVCLIDTKHARKAPRPEGVEIHEVPFGDLVARACPKRSLRAMVINLVYVGVLAQYLQIEAEVVIEQIRHVFRSKPKAQDINIAAFEEGWSWARDHLGQHPTHRAERRDKTKDMILVDGNEATALGCIFGGCTVLTWYPITPSSSLGEAFISWSDELRRDEASQAKRVAVVQAEDEIAAIGMATGAGWAGARAMTTTSGPGISLMTEIVGLAYYAEIPVVLVDVQRVGPSTGMPTRTAQGDILQIAFLSHGDTRHIALFPGSVKECFEFGWRCFDLAERLQAPVFLVSDLDLGMNPWISEPFDYPDQPMDRGKVLDEEALEALAGVWHRYDDPDGDGIPRRTIPGTHHPAAGYFTRGSGHDPTGAYTEDGEGYMAVVDRLSRKYDHARTLVPQPVIDQDPEAAIGIIAYGSSDPAVVEARDILREEAGQKTSYLRIRALPLTRDLQRFIRDHEQVYVIDQNRDGQMADLIRLELAGTGLCDRISSIRHYSGWPIDAQFLVDAILQGVKSASPTTACC